MTAICCPGGARCPDHRMSKADLVDELQRTRAELAAVKAERDQLRDLLQAIGDLVEAPLPEVIAPADTPDYDPAKWFMNYEDNQRAHRQLQQMRTSHVKIAARRLQPEQLPYAAQFLRKHAPEVTYPVSETAAAGADT